MAINTYPFILQQKKQLTHNVYELVFASPGNEMGKVGQYILFTLPSGLKRAYSIALTDGTIFRFIIKGILPEHGGRGGSKEITDLEE